MVGDVTHYTLSSLHTRTKSIFLNFNQNFVCFLAMFDDHFRECAQHTKKRTKFYAIFEHELQTKTNGDAHIHQNLT